MAVSSGYGGPNYSQIEGQLRNVAVQFTAILEAQRQIAASVATWRELERQLALAQAAAGGTRQDFQAMEAAARNFALSSTYSVGQVAQAFYSLASAGLTVKETLSAATGVVLLAQATLEDLGSASETVAASLAQFNLQASDSYRVANLLVASTNSSLATLPKLSYALKQVGPAASEMGLSIEQTVGILDKLFDAGMRGEQAGTALRNNLMRLTDPRGVGGLALRAYGISLRDAEGNIRGYIDRMQELARKNPGQAALTQIFGLQGAVAARIQIEELNKAMANGQNALDAHIKAISNTDAAYRQAAIQMDTLDGRIKIMQNSFNDLRIMVGQAIVPVFGLLGDIVENVTEHFRNMDTTQKAGFLSTVLWMGQIVLAGKMISNFGLGMFTAARQGKLLVDAFGEMKKANAELRMLPGQNGTYGPFQFMANAQPVMRRVISLLGTMINAVTGFAVLATAIYGVAKAIEAVNDAAKQARIANVSTNVYANYAQRHNLTPDQTSALSDQRNVASSFSRQADQLTKLFPEQASGEGAYQRIRAMNEMIRQGSDEIKNLGTQIDAQREEFNKFGAKRLQLRDAIGKVYDLGNIWDPANYGLETKLVASGAGQQGVNAILSQMTQIGAASPQNLKQLFTAYYQQLDNSIKQASNISTVEKARAHVRIQQIVEQIAGADQGSLEVMQKAFRDAAAKGQEQLAKSGADRALFGVGVRSYTTTMRNIMQQVYHDVDQNLVLTKEELDNQIANLRSQQRAIQGTIDRLNQSLPEETAALGKNILNSIIGTGQLDARQVQVLKQAAASPQGLAALKQVMVDIQKNRLTWDQTIKEYGDLIGATRLGIQVGITKAVENGGGVPLVDERAMQAKFDQEHIKFLDAMLKASELSGKSDTVQRMRDLTVAKNASDQKQFLDAFFKDLNAHGDTGTQDAIDRLRGMPGIDDTITRLLTELSSQQGDAREKTISRIQQVLTKGLDANAMTRVRSAIIAAAEGLRASRLQNANALKEYVNRANTTLTSDQNFVKQLLGLPTAEELYLQAQKIETEARFRIAEYLNMPLSAVARAFEDLQVSQRQSYADFQKKYRKFFTDDIAKGLDNVVNDPAMTEAFNGQLVQRILSSSGPTSVFGQQFTAASLRTAEGMRRFIDAISKQFEAVAGREGASVLPQRVAAARRILTGVVSEMTAMYDSFGSQIEELNLKQMDAQRKASEFITNFERENLIRNFQQAMAEASDSPTKVGITIDVALNARVAEIKINATETVQKLREQYAELFRNLNVPVYLDAQGNFKLGDTATGGSLPQFPAIQAGGANPAAQVPQATVNAVAAQFTPVVGKGIEQQLINLFTSTIRNPYGIAAALATTRAENGAFNPGAFNQAGSGAFGFAQWMGPRRDALINMANRMGRSATDPQVQMSHWLAEMRGPESSVLQRLQNASSPEEALNAYMDFERTDGWRRGRPQGSVYYNRAQRYQQQYLSRAGVAGVSAMGPEAPVVPITQAGQPITDAMRKIAEDWIKSFNEQRRRIEEAAAVYADYIQHDQVARIADAFDNFQKNMNEHFDATEGRALTNTANMYGAQGQTRSIMAAAAGRAGDFTAQRQYTIEAQINAIYKERAETLRDIDRGMNVEIAVLQAQANEELKNNGTSERHQMIQDRIRLLLAQQLRLHQQINEAAARQAADAGKNAADIRTSLDIEMASRTAIYNTFENQDPMQGLRTSVLQFAKEVPTVFETMQQVGYTALSGLANIGAGLLSGSVTNVRQAVASMLQAMAQLLAKMVIMWAFIQLIRMVPGGSALLATMDMSARATGHADGGVSGGPGNPITVQYNADGGAMGLSALSVLSKGQRRLGGVRPPNKPAMSIHGEGDLPEAYIPMVDRRSIPVRINDDGTAYVPLPSGMMIPVNFGGAHVRRFASGGYSIGRARRADGVALDGADAVSRYRGQRIPAQTQPVQSTVSNTFKMDLHFHGNTTAGDAKQNAEAAAIAIDRMLTQRELENSRRSARNRGSIGDQYGVFG